MVNERLIIPQENIYKTEEVRYLDNQELKTRKPTENDFFICSPNSNEDKANSAIVGIAGAIGTGILTYVCPPAWLAAAGIYTTIGTAAKITHHVAKDQNTKDAAEIFDITFNIASAGGGVGKSVNSLGGIGG